MLKPRKRFGQHFLIDPWIIQKIIESLSLQKNDTVIEIGPGRGALTFPLLELLESLKIDCNVMAVEIDRDLVKYLTEKIKNNNLKNIAIVNQDILKTDFTVLYNINNNPLKIIGNLPYNISTPVLFHLLHYKQNISELVFMLQKEVVSRICAQCNTPNYGRLSVMIQHYFEVEWLFDVPHTAFDPPPKVESAVLRLIPKPDSKKLSKKLFNEGLFSNIVREAFQYRRKTLRHGLQKYFTEQALLECGISPKCRPGELSVQDFEKLTECCHV